MSFIEFQNVVRQYGEGESLVTAVDHINFQIDRGEFVVILGNLVLENQPY